MGFKFDIDTWLNMISSNLTDHFIHDFYRDEMKNIYIKSTTPINIVCRK